MVGFKPYLSCPNMTDIVIQGDYYYIKAGNDLITMDLARCPSDYT
jgi:hypothetical protein